MIRRREICGALLATVSAWCSATLAGPLPTDGNAIPGWQGSQLYSVAVATLLLQANVEYAVYAPGNFGASFGAAADPSAGTQYVYAYQIFNDLLGNRNVGNLTVGLNGHNELASNIGILDGFGQNPNDAYFVPAAPPSTSAKWDFLAGNVLAVGAHSDLLVFTSPFAPEWDTATLQGGSALGQTNRLPSPVPEPGSLLLAACLGGSVLLLARRRLRSA